MGFTLEKVAPWGRSYGEYIAMFGLAEIDLKQRILSCGDGPAGFNSELTRRGGCVTSVDPIYVFDAAQIRSRVSETYKAVIAQLRKNQDDYVWKSISSVEELGRVRMLAMNTFLLDYESGKNDGRYIPGELPSLPFASGKFDIALSSHFLFLYSADLSAEFHIQALWEMLRVSHEARVFPLLTLNGSLSPHFDFVTERLISHGFSAGIKRVSYEFQRGGNEMLLVKPVSQ